MERDGRRGARFLARCTAARRAAGAVHAGKFGNCFLRPPSRLPALNQKKKKKKKKPISGSNGSINN